MKATPLHNSQYDFNKEWALKVGKAKFKKNQEHLSELVDLDAVWDGMQKKDIAEVKAK